MRIRKPRKGAALLLLGNSLILSLLLAGGFRAFLSAYDIKANQPVLLPCCCLFALLSAALWSVRGGGWAAVAGIALMGIAAWRTWDRLGLAVLLIRRRIWTGSSGPGVRMSALEFEAAQQALLPALLLLAAALALWLGWVVIWARGWYLAAAIVTLPLLPAILAGTLPDWTGLMAGAAGWISLLLTALYDKQDTVRLARGTLVSVAGSVTLLWLLTAALPQGSYERPQWATGGRQFVLSAVSDGLERIPGWYEAPGSLILDTGGRPGGTRPSIGGVGPGREKGISVVSGRLDLLNAGPQRYKGQAMLVVHTNQPDPEGSLYLLGGTAAEYTGESWDEASVVPDYSILDSLSYTPPASEGYVILPELFPDLTAGNVPAYLLKIRNMTGGGMAFAPYRPAEAVPTDPGRDYAIAYRPGGPADSFYPLEGRAKLEETLYRDFVYQQYLSVPERTEAVLSPLAEALQQEVITIEAGMPPEFLEDVSAAQRTAQYLAKQAVYDLDVPAMERGGDFVEHFLAEGRGYCVHFATAGAMLLRMQGIPARYASGYVAHLDASGYGEVLDSNAHAWVEIYLDGYGWYPVEMTPPSGGGGGERPEDEGSAPAAPVAPTPQEPEQPVQDEPEQPEQPDEQEKPAPKPENSQAEESPVQVQEPVDLTWLWYTVLALAVLSSPYAVYRLALLRRQKIRELADTNRSVIAAYGRYRRLMAWGCGEDPELEALARKAKFSQHKLDAQERSAAWERVEALSRQAGEALPGWKRRILRLLRPLF